eukprot:2883942-Pyramimonas_sp.AAC.1
MVSASGDSRRAVLNPLGASWRPRVSSRSNGGRAGGALEEGPSSVGRRSRARRKTSETSRITCTSHAAL